MKIRPAPASILFIDTATSGCYVAVAATDAAVIARGTVMGRGQAESLVPMLEDVLTQAGTVPDAIMVTAGPGSFTGVRIGLAAANTLAQVYDRPVYAITAFDAYRRSVCAAQLMTTLPMLTVIETRRDDFFISATDDDSAMRIMDADTLLARHGAMPFRVIGDGVPRLARVIEPWPVQWSVDAMDTVLDAGAVARDLLRALPITGQQFPITPIYLREAETSTTITAGR